MRIPHYYLLGLLSLFQSFNTYAEANIQHEAIQIAASPLFVALTRHAVPSAAARCAPPATRIDRIGIRNIGEYSNALNRPRKALRYKHLRAHRNTDFWIR